MPIQALQVLERKIERQIRLFELKNRALGRKLERKIATQKERIGQKFDAHKQRIEQKFDAHKLRIEQTFDAHKLRIEQTFDAQRKKFESHIRRFEQKNGIRIDDEFRFFRTWMENPLSVGAVTPSGKALARTMASYVDPESVGPVIELGPGTGPVTEALVARGIDPARLVLVEFDPTFCRLLRKRYPEATVVQGDAYGLRVLLNVVMRQPAAAVVSGLPLFTKPLKMRLRLLLDAFGLMAPGAPFVQFTYAAYSPIPRRLDRVKSQASERIWTNIPPARVWVYRKY
jgi:phosphatidylethanolamine/phosphatidyl-N-methylethanolamine N-methyltransferase